MNRKRNFLDQQTDKILDITSYDDEAFIGLIHSQKLEECRLMFSGDPEQIVSSMISFFSGTHGDFNSVIEQSFYTLCEGISEVIHKDDMRLAQFKSILGDAIIERMRSDDNEAKLISLKPR